MGHYGNYYEQDDLKIEEAKRQHAIEHTKKLMRKIEDSTQKMNLEQIRATNYVLRNIDNIANLVLGLKNTDF